MESKELSKDLRCIFMRNGVQIWIEEEYISDVTNVLHQSTQSKFIEIGNEIVNTADIVGIFTPETLDDYTRRRNGEWKCNYGKWHESKTVCLCARLELEKLEEKKREEFFAQNGYYPLGSFGSVSEY